MKYPRPSFLLLSGLLLAASAARATETTPDLDWLQQEQAPQLPTPRRGADLPPVFRAALPLREAGEIEVPAETTELLGAARAGDLARVKALLKDGAQPNAADLRGERALPLAVRAGRLELARHLLASGASPDLRGADGLTPLCIAALDGNLALVRVLLKAGANVDLRGAHGNTPLLDAVLMNRPGVVRALLARDPDLERYDREGLHALALAARDGRGEILEALLAHHGTDLEFPDKGNRTALFWAIFKRQRQSVDLLLARGADPGAMSTEF